MGVAKLRLGESAEKIIERTDEALYRAKHLGRNRVVSEMDLENDVDLAL